MLHLSRARALLGSWAPTRHAYRLLRGRRRALRELEPYVPYSSGTLRQLTRLTYDAASRTPVLLDGLARAAGAARATRTTTEGFWQEFGSADPAVLEVLFNAYGSDKAAKHDYHLVYAAIVGDVWPRAMLEVGLGSNNTDVVSNMGRQGVPGASLRAFRDAVPGCHVYGADIDERVLFTEERIDTFHVDQTDRESLHALGEVLPDGLDLVIDDGLHTPDANLAVLSMSLGKVRPGGWIVIEDIRPSAAPLWEAVAGLLPDHDCYLIQSRAALLFCVKTSGATE